MRVRPAAPAAGKEVNACGCYTNAAGACFCGRGKGKGKDKCACPGECEPKGCEQKRAKQMQKEIAAETRKAADADRRQRQGETRRPNDKGAETGDRRGAKHQGAAAGAR